MAYAAATPSTSDPTGNSDWPGQTGASWGGSQLEWCVGTPVWTAYVCRNFSIGKAYVTYDWQQRNYGNRSVTVLSWYPIYEGYTCWLLGCSDTKVQQPSFELTTTAINTGKKNHFWSAKDTSQPNTDYWAPGGVDGISVGRYGWTAQGILISTSTYGWKVIMPCAERLRELTLEWNSGRTE